MNLYNTYKLAMLHVHAYELEPSIYMAPGGGDIDPALYGAEDEGSYSYSSLIDKYEFEIVSEILNKGWPLIAICRGHQLVTAAAGGTLIQDLRSAGFTRHSHNVVTIDPDSRLAELSKPFNITKDIYRANSLHHQAVKDVPEGWNIAAMSSDGVIEAIENKNLPVISVQWHPEMLGHFQHYLRWLRDQYDNLKIQW